MRNWLQKKVHISWHIAFLSAGVVAGTASALVLPMLFTDILWPITGLFLACWAGLKRWRWLCLVMLVAGGLVGAGRGMAEQRALQRYQSLYGQQSMVRGVLRDDASLGAHGEQRFTLSDVQIGGLALAGQVWISSSQKSDIKRGDTVTVKGKLDPGFGTLAASMYRATTVRIERPHPGDIARIFRDWFADGIRKSITEPQASLGIGYLTGQRNSLPPLLDEQLRTVGLTHAVVASGYNLTILVSFARNLLQGISKYLATTTACLLVAAFMLVTGFSPSMTRAGLVSGLGLATWYYGRVAHPLVLLPMAAAITVLLKPAYVWGDIGWCLSFAAFVGVIILAPLLEAFFWPEQEKPPLVLGLVVETTAAQLTTLPIILYSFGQFATFALPANLLVLPLVPLAMLGTFLAGVAGLVAPSLGDIAGWPATQLLHYMTWIVGFIADLPGATKQITFSGKELVGSYVLLSLLVLLLWKKTAYDFRGLPKSKKF